MSIRGSMAFMLTALGVLCGALAGHGATKTCGAETLPASAWAVVKARFPGMRIVQLRDLRGDDQRLWARYGSGECPGITSGNFGPHGAQAYAVALFRRTGVSYQEAVVVVSGNAGAHHLMVLSRPDRQAYLLVLNRVPPGKLTDVYSGKKVETKIDSVAYVAMEAVVVVFYWDKGRYRYVMTSE